MQRLSKGAGYSPPALMLRALFNIPVALLLILLSSPVLLAVAVAVWVRDGGPVIYRGKRLGLNKKPFTMYKFRTLVPNASMVVAADLLGNMQYLVTPIGRFLRDSRLDELPQLFNVLKGDMDLVGPRPVRPEVYARMCEHLPGYDERFAVKPGLVGIAQLYTPHSTPKALRSVIDRMLLRRRRSILWDMKVLFLSALTVARAAVFRGARCCWQCSLVRKLRGGVVERRGLERIRQDSAQVFAIDPENPGRFVLVGELVDVNLQAFLLRSDEPVSGPFPRTFRLQTEFRRRLGARRKLKRARCEGTLYREGESEDGRYEYVFAYSPVSPLNLYMIHQYFLRESVVSFK